MNNKDYNITTYEDMQLGSRKFALKKKDAPVPKIRAKWLQVRTQTPNSSKALVPTNNADAQPSKHFWLVVWIPLKNISQFGLLFPIYGKIKNVPNHQSDFKCVACQQCQNLATSLVETSDSDQLMKIHTD